MSEHRARRRLGEALNHYAEVMADAQRCAEVALFRTRKLAWVPIQEAIDELDAARERRRQKRRKAAAAHRRAASRRKAA
jgi:hypothetical protein